MSHQGSTDEMTKAEPSAQRRAKARARGITLAAKVATIGGLAVAALALVEARAAADDGAKVEDTEGLLKASKNCGCSPCWGPPAPPCSRGV